METVSLRQAGGGLCYGQRQCLQLKHLIKHNSRPRCSSGLQTCILYCPLDFSIWALHIPLADSTPRPPTPTPTPGAFTTCEWLQCLPCLPSENCCVSPGIPCSLHWLYINCLQVSLSHFFCILATPSSVSLLAHRNHLSPHFSLQPAPHAADRVLVLKPQSHHVGSQLRTPQWAPFTGEDGKALMNWSLPISPFSSQCTK